ncbi:NitT/TauT family transport system substrate-binding protein [Crossiella equi]|uniref:NitT/TauT family transport system substrate-binding protein n=1 Tax=Crossiella equi TaxID=130796 RepID=A0ABS5AR08_9PSEU|nr:ABC transporter substrate-binding protein [Crossiella equi]MBP2479009.1 NitT/TauT family transport system substrate-binding protein [Crossiella equi]
MFRRPRLLATLCALLLAATGCGVLGGASGSTGAAAKETRIRLGIMPVVDVAPVHIALSRGYFAAEGLNVELTPIQGGAAGIQGLLKDELDFTFGNWVSFFATEAKGAARNAGGIKLAADGYQARANMFLVLTGPDSAIRSPKDLAGKKIAINTFRNILELTAKATLEANNVDPKSVQFLEMPFPDMQAAVQSKKVDAAFMVEPFITKAERTLGAVPVLDAASGPTSDIPIAGYATTGAFARDHPGAVSAFRRALVKGQQDAARKSTVEALLPGFAQIDPETAALVHFGVYPISMDATRLQRVADLMRTYGLLDAPMDIKPMLLTGGTQ